MATNRVSKSCLMAELSFHRFVHFDFVPIYLFGFHRKLCASNQKDFTFVMSTTQLLSCADGSLSIPSLRLAIKFSNNFTTCKLNNTRRLHVMSKYVSNVA